jgi:hypothetical protein
MSAVSLSRSLTTSRPLVLASTIALVGIAYFAAIIVALHFLRPDLNPLQRPTSEYAVGPYGYLMASAFFSMSAASLALASGLARGIAPSARSRVGLGLLGLWGLNLLIAMIFPIDPEGAAPTLAGSIHSINGPVGFLSLSLGMVLISRRFKHDVAWRPIQRPAVLLALGNLATFLAFPLLNATGTGLLGLAQRIALALIVAWYLLTASRLRSSDLGSARG